MKERFVLSPENATKFETGDAGVVENLSENAAALASSAGALLREKGLRRVRRALGGVCGGFTGRPPYRSSPL
jgi:hypothetical protein